MSLEVVFFDLGDTLVRTPRDFIPGAQAVLSSLLAKGLRLGIVSNTDALTRAQVLQLLPATFDLAIFEPGLVLFSSEVGMEKPDRAIFDLAVARSGVAASACLYCSENLVETLAAQRAGLFGARVQKPPGTDLQALLSALDAAGLLG